MTVVLVITLSIQTYNEDNICKQLDVFINIDRYYILLCYCFSCVYNVRNIIIIVQFGFKLCTFSILYIIRNCYYFRIISNYSPTRFTRSVLLIQILRDIKTLAKFDYLISKSKRSTSCTRTHKIFISHFWKQNKQQP